MMSWLNVTRLAFCVSVRELEKIWFHYVWTSYSIFFPEQVVVMKWRIGLKKHWLFSINSQGFFGSFGFIDPLISICLYNHPIACQFNASNLNLSIFEVFLTIQILCRIAPIGSESDLFKALLKGKHLSFSKIIESYIEIKSLF